MTFNIVFVSLDVVIPLVVSAILICELIGRPYFNSVDNVDGYVECWLNVEC